MVSLNLKNKYILDIKIINKYLKFGKIYCNIAIMGKLAIKLLIAFVGVGIASISEPVVAGTSFRMSSKSPVATPAPSYRGYVFGYGGGVFGNNWSNIGAFDLSSYNWRDHCPPDMVSFPGLDPTHVPMDWETEGGWTLGGGIGAYSGFLGGSRFELEGSYLTNDVHRLTYAGIELPANFSLNTKTAMVNFLKEVPFAHATGYFGGGVGWGWTSMEGDIDTIMYDDNDSGFAWQLIAGIDIPITERLALFMQYRYLVLSETSFTTNFGDFTTVSSDKPDSHSVLIGARVSF